ncbi:MAG: ATP-binding protein [Elusimicrobiales bacterium]|nr:ATP-binding protein [Elusimicrobiales bacterium]
MGDKTVRSIRLRKYAVDGLLAFTFLAFLLIAFLAARILDAGRQAVFDDMRNRVVTLSKGAGVAMFPREDLFFLHALVNSVATDGIIKYACIMDRSGRIRSHSSPERIGDIDATPEGEASRAAGTTLKKDFKCPDGLECHYFSAPIWAGSRRVGTASIVIDSETMAPRLAGIRERLLLILLSLGAVVTLLLVIRCLLRKVERAAELKSAMIHTVSHEFNNALSGLEGGVFLLKEGESRERLAELSPVYDMLSEVQGNLRTFVKNILSDARLESGRFTPEPRRVFLRDIADRCALSVEELMAHKNISLEMERGGRVPVEADQELIALVISNLMGNAVKYTPPGGKISIHVTRHDGEVPGAVFSIRNTGEGIPAGELDRLKEAFYRSDSGRAAASGYGLGLKIVNDLLALHFSALEISSEPGKSATFSFRLPLHQPPKTAPAGRFISGLLALYESVHERLRRFF